MEPHTVIRYRCTALVLILAALMSAGCSGQQAVSPENQSLTTNDGLSADETAVSVQSLMSVLHEPLVTENSELPGGTQTQWDCVWFGSYPASEVVGGDYTAVGKGFFRESDLIVDARLLEQLSQAEWIGNEAVLDGVSYRRIRSEGMDSREAHYRWDAAGEWHYFRYEPIRWRVIGLDGGIAELMADRQLDCEPYHTKAGDVYWETCTLRSFLNGYDSTKNTAGADFSAQPGDSFYETAFSEEEKRSIVQTVVENPPNYYFGTECGNDTEDAVYILDEQEIFMTDAALRHGFAKSDATNDPARRFQPTLYAMAKGAWYSPLTQNRGNGFWFVRTCGYTPSNVNYICDFGAVYNRGTFVTADDAGIIPAIRIDLATAPAEYAGTVSSADIFIPAAEDSGGNAREDSPVSDGITQTGALSEPVVEEDASLSSGLRTTWECVSFGAYPTSEVVARASEPVASYAVPEDGQIIDPALYAKLSAAEWTGNDLELDGEKYRRITAADTELLSSDSAQHYQWDSGDTYHYFRYEPIRWRVIECDGDNVLLLADRELDCVPYHSSAEDVTWKDCTLRSFLNGYGADRNAAHTDFTDSGFLNTAFSPEEQAHILAKQLSAPANTYYGTDCGSMTEDKVFLLSCEDVFSSELASDHGFYAGSGVDDPAKRFRPTMYAMARGTWYSPVADYKGNGFWFMRTNGYSRSNVTYICDFGYIYNRGTNVSCNDAGILPAMWVDPLALKPAGHRTSG